MDLFKTLKDIVKHAPAIELEIQDQSNPTNQSEIMTIFDKQKKKIITRRSR